MFAILKELMYLIALILLIIKIKNSKNCLGLSSKTQETSLLASIVGYSDLFYSFTEQSALTILIRVFTIMSTGYLIYLMRIEKPYCVSYNIMDDEFKHWNYLVPAAFVGALFFNRGWTFFNIIISFSIWLQSLSLIPQLVMLARIQETENLLPNYVITLGCYHMFIVLEVIQVGITETHMDTLIAGIVQIIIFSNFYYYYAKSTQGQKWITLPA